MHPSPSSRSGEVFSRVVLPLVLFVVVVGGIAWVTQYLPSGGGRTPSRASTGDVPNTDQLLKFNAEQAVFDKGYPDYGQEIETDEMGHYDFPFENISGKELQLGLQFKNCGCTQIDLKVGNEKLVPMVQSDKEKDSHIVGVGASGVVRFNWKGNKNVGSAQRLMVDLWCQDKGVAKTRKFQKLQAKIMVVPPLMFQPDKEDLGAVSDRTLHFACWSATRKNVKISLKDDANPCFAYTIRPMTEDETKKLSENLKGTSHVKSAFHVDVAISQEKNGRFLDQGYLEHKATLVLHDDTSANLTTEVTGPTIKGIVSGPVVIGVPDDNGKFKLGEFTAGEEGAKRSTTLSTDAKLELKLDSQFPNAKNMKVTLTKVDADSTSERTIWKLEIDIGQSSFGGSLPDNSYIMLQTSQGRKIRIPVIGRAK